MNEEIKGLLQALVDGKELQAHHGIGWVVLPVAVALRRVAEVIEGKSSFAVRVKPATTTINGVEVPAPESVAPSIGTLFYTPRANSLPGFVKCGWDDGPHEELLLKRGQVWLKEDDIKQVVKALGWAE